MPTILLAQEDPEAAANLAALLREFFPTATLEPLSDFAALTTALTSNRHAALLLTDIFWADQNRAEEILLLAEADPVYAWRERMLDLFDGLARKAPGVGA